MARFTRFKILRALWARARTLIAWLGGPYDREARLRAQRWQQIQVAERQIRDGIVRGTGDPDSYIRPRTSAQNDYDGQEWRAQWEAQRRWYEEQRQRQAQRRNGR